MPYKDVEQKRAAAKRYYHKRCEEDPQYRITQNAVRDQKLKNDPEYRKQVNKQAREARQERSKNQEWRDNRNLLRRGDYERNHIHYLLKACKYRAKKEGREFTIDETDITIPAVCPILGIPIQKGVSKPSDNSPNIDRIDNTKGYIKGNVWVISHRANRIKNNATLEELELIVQALRKMQY